MSRTSSPSCSRSGCRRPLRAAGVEAVGVYHMVLEGVVFTAGQLALLELVDDRLPGLREGTELVLRDERWHVGFGDPLPARRGALGRR